MSGLYNMLFGIHPWAVPLIMMLFDDQKAHKRIPRFRDCLPMKREGEDWRIEVLTRTCGDNRTEYEEASQWLRDHPLFVKEKDEPYDDTYAHFVFSVPDTDDGKAMVRIITEELGEDFVTPTFQERWERAIKAMENR